jgi:hypothetical protein
MKYGVNRITIRLLAQQVDGLVVKELNFILGVQKSNFTNAMHCGQHWNIDRIFRPI